MQAYKFYSKTPLHARLLKRIPKVGGMKLAEQLRIGRDQKSRRRKDFTDTFGGDVILGLFADIRFLMKG